MNIIYARQDYDPPQSSPMIFLVGPTPRNQDVPSWRPKALNLLREFDGLVFVPEPEDRIWRGNYIDQITWERGALDNCASSGIIAAWVPRELKTMPAFTTNVEFGFYVSSGNLWYGRPCKAPKTRYLDELYRDVAGREPCNTLEELIDIAMIKAEEIFQKKEKELKKGKKML